MAWIPEKHVTLKKQLKNLTQLPFLYFKKIGMVQTVAWLGKFTLQQSEKLQLMKKKQAKVAWLWWKLNTERQKAQLSVPVIK